MTRETSAPVDGGYTGRKTAKQRLLERYELNHAKTLNVLRAFPGAKSEFRPHERSNTALRLAWTFVVEERIILKAVRGEQVMGGGFPSPPETWDGVLDLFTKGYDDVVAALRDPSNPELQGSVTFPSGPKQTTDFPIEAFTTFMLDDQIHHRGQLSVYVRMAGGMVPAIYGPSADEPWS
jgi:uncharacterized damage-inducible protein DinB